MRLFNKILSLTLLFSVCPYLVNATVFKVEDYYDRNDDFNSKRIRKRSCDDINETLWDVKTCGPSTHGRMVNPFMCKAKWYSNDCECESGYVRREKDNPVSGEDKAHFNIISSEMKNRDRNNQPGELQFYCVKEPTSCNDSNYVMVYEEEELVNSKYDISLNSNTLNISRGINNSTISIHNKTESPVYTFNLGNKNYYCAPNYTDAYEITPIVDDKGDKKECASLIDFDNSRNTYSSKASGVIGGKLDQLHLYYRTGCTSGYSLYIEGVNDISCPNGDNVETIAGNPFYYINNNGQCLSGYCGKCNGCGNSYDLTTQTLSGSLGDSEVAAGAFSERNCKLSCAPGYTQIYIGNSNNLPPKLDSASGTCKGNWSDCGNISQYANANHFVFTYYKLTKNVNGMNYHLVCAEPTGCNVETGYINKCETTCWKSFFYKDNN